MVFVNTWFLPGYRTAGLKEAAGGRVVGRESLADGFGWSFFGGPGAHLQNADAGLTRRVRLDSQPVKSPPGGRQPGVSRDGDTPNRK